jgi:hypothetical protein
MPGEEETPEEPQESGAEEKREEETPEEPEEPQESCTEEQEKEAVLPPVFPKQFDQIKEIIARFEEKGIRTNIAIVADPFAGQHNLAQQIHHEYKDRISCLPFFSIVSTKDFLSNYYQAEKIILVERCHFLAMRKIGGFVMLEEFLDFLSTTDKFLITTWNSFAWSYLDEVKKISSFFPVVIKLPKMQRDTLKNHILSEYEQEITFIDDTEHEKKPLLSRTTRTVEIPLLKESVDVPWIQLTLRSRNMLKQDESQMSAEDMVFDEINRIANGNFGVARRLWERTITDHTVKMSAVPVTPCTVDLDINQTFLATIILSMESIKMTDLAEIAGPEIDIEQTLYQLANQGLVERDREYFQIKPEALNCVIDFLKRKRMVW